MWFDLLPLWPLFALATVGWGAPLAGPLLFTDEMTSAERWAWSFLLGLGLVGFAMMAVGHLGLLHPGVAWAMLAAGVAVAGVKRRALGVPDVRALWAGPLIVLVTLTMLWQAWGCLTPEIGGDALNYHVNAPRQWIDRGRMDVSPLQFMAAITAHQTMIATWCLLIGQDVLCKLMQTTGLMATLVLIHGMVGRHTDRRAADLAVALALFNLTAAWYPAPAELRSDLLTLLFAAGAIGAAERLLTTLAPRWAALVGICLALAVGTKYTALVYLIAPLAIALGLGLLRRSPDAGRLIGLLAVTVVSGLVAFLPWALREWLITGDPLYPLLSDHLRIDPAFDIARQQVMAYESLSGPEASALPLFNLGIDLRMRVMRTITSGDHLYLLSLPLALIGLLVGRGLMRFASIHMAVAHALHLVVPLADVERFFALTTPVSAALVAGMLWSVARQRLAVARLMPAVGIALFAMMLLRQWQWLQREHIPWRGLPVMSGPAVDEYIRQGEWRLRDAMTVYQWMDDNLPPDARILCVNHPYSYHLPRWHWTRGRWCMEVFDWLLLQENGDVDAVERRLRTEGITHVLRVEQPFPPDHPYHAWEASRLEPLFEFGNAHLFAMR